jgi:hypothetical protein
VLVFISNHTRQTALQSSLAFYFIAPCGCCAAGAAQLYTYRAAAHGVKVVECLLSQRAVPDGAWLQGCRVPAVAAGCASPP